MENKYNIKCIKFSSQEELDKAEELANKEGYFVVSGKKTNFEYIKNYYEEYFEDDNKLNSEYVLDCFYNTINKKKEYQYSCMRIVKG